MSTILDALRKLQGDRDAMTTSQRRDLRSSVLEGRLPPVRTQRAERKTRPWIAALGGGVVAAGCIGAFLIWSGSEGDSFEGAASSPEMPDAPQLAQAPPPPPAPVTRAPEPLVNLAAPPEPPPASREARYAALQPSASRPEPEPEPEPVDLNEQEQAQELPSSSLVPSSDRPRRKRRRSVETPAILPDAPVGLDERPPPMVRPPKSERPQIVVRRESTEAPQDAELETAMNRARERLARSESRASEQLARREEPPPREEAEPERPAEERPEAVTVGIPFPALEVRSVLWHPDPLRRQATILLDGQLATDAREGDLIGGVLIDRIAPGSVEFRMGQQLKRVDMAP